MALFWKNRYAFLSAPKPIFTVLVAASGNGTRLGGIYKPLLALDGRPTIAYALEAFEKSGFVKQIVVSALEEHIDEVRAAAAEAGITKLTKVVPGGATRTESVTKAFRAAFENKEDITPFVAVHDAARPLITTKNIDDVFFACVKYGGAVAAMKVRDALKKADLAGVLTENVERDQMWQMQTPQAFDTDIFHTSLAVAEQLGTDAAVDDAALVMKAGFKVVCVDTGSLNFKVTYPEDIEMAEAILRYRKG